MDANNAPAPATKAELEKLREDYRAKRPLTDRQYELLAVLVNDKADEADAAAAKMSVDTFEAPRPRAWNDNHPWLLFECAAAENGSVIRLNGRAITLRWVFQMENFKEDLGDDVYFRGLAYDRDGTFYGITEHAPDGRSSRRKTAVEQLTGKRALAWFVRHAAWDAPFARELCRAIDNPEFEFMPLVPTREQPKKKRKARKSDAAFYEQLQLATALVEVVRKLDHEPTVENLSDACRSASALHQSLHAPENFKRATA